jgi:hypothetical protein
MAMVGTSSVRSRAAASQATRWISGIGNLRVQVTRRLLLGQPIRAGRSEETTVTTSGGGTWSSPPGGSPRRLLTESKRAGEVVNRWACAVAVLQDSYRRKGVLEPLFGPLRNSLRKVEKLLSHLGGKRSPAGVSRSLLGLRAYRQPDKPTQRLGTLSCLRLGFPFSSTSALL